MKEDKLKVQDFVYLIKPKSEVIGIITKHKKDFAIILKPKNFNDPSKSLPQSV